ncbi:type II toxin-antitoxin system PemK/MazF family toxin [Candidatus Pacearchaeota archaeon]|nr:type II toxin-antitoxin system PemK/MazF family toxin [Candidatus Pacearchaeota archaeon]
MLEGTIPLKSRVKVDKLFTLDKSIVIKSVARLNKDAFQKIREEFCRLV